MINLKEYINSTERSLNYCIFWT